MGTNNAQRLTIAQETLQILAQGHYFNRAGERVDVDNGFAEANTEYFDADGLERLHAELSPRRGFSTRFEVNNETTLAAAHRLWQQGYGAPLCLNFASAKNPGGGFMRGSEAQEENLAKSSGLYPCLLRAPQYYKRNRACGSAFYRDDMIYSPRVPVFRDDNYALLDRIFSVDMLTAPAVNRGAVKENAPERLGEVESVMLHRMDLLLNLAARQGQTVLVLGAWGCGVFANRADEMAGWFASHLLQGGRYEGVFDLVSFAVYDRRNDGTCAAFERFFGNDSLR